MNKTDFTILLDASIEKSLDSVYNIRDCAVNGEVWLIKVEWLHRVTSLPLFSYCKLLRQPEELNMVEKERNLNWSKHTLTVPDLSIKDIIQLKTVWENFGSLRQEAGTYSYQVMVATRFPLYFSCSDSDQVLIEAEE